jgi:hypothetical protein
MFRKYFKLGASTHFLTLVIANGDRTPNFHGLAEQFPTDI